jgi:hypothetical protein
MEVTIEPLANGKNDVRQVSKTGTVLISGMDWTAGAPLATVYSPYANSDNNQHVHSENCNRKCDMFALNVIMFTRVNFSFNIDDHDDESEEPVLSKVAHPTN